MEEIKLFFFVLSIIFTIRFVVEFVLKLLQTEETEPIAISKVEGIFLYIALSYIITYILI